MKDDYEKMLSETKVKKLFDIKRYNEMMVFGNVWGRSDLKKSAPSFLIERRKKI